MMIGVPVNLSESVQYLSTDRYAETLEWNIAGVAQL